MPFRVVSGLSINVIPSTIRKIAIIKRFRIIVSTLLEIFSTFLMVLSKFDFLDIMCINDGTPDRIRTYDT